MENFNKQDLNIGFDKHAKETAKIFLKPTDCINESYNNWQRLLGFTISHLNWLETLKDNDKKSYWDAFKIEDTTK